MGLFSGFLSRMMIWRPSPGHSGPTFHGPTIPKVWVTESSALQLSTVWACVRFLAGTMSILPWRVHELGENDNREINPGDPADYLLHVAPNPEMTPADWISAMMFGVEFSGGGFSYIERNGRFDPIGLWPIHSSRVRVCRSDGDTLYYAVQDDLRGPVLVPPEDMFHIKGPTIDGYVGLNTIDAGRESIALGLAAERFGAAFYGHALRPSGVLQMQEEMSDKAYRRLKKAYNEKTGSGKAGKVLILEGKGAEWKSIGIAPDEAQHNETRLLQIREICRWFGVKPHKVSDLEHAHFTNIEHEGIESVQDTFLPRIVRFEQEANRKLIGPSHRAKRYTKFNVRGLLRGDAKTQSEAFAIDIQNGIRTRDEVRGLLELNRSDDGFGDKYWKPKNMGYADDPPEQKAAPASSGQREDDTEKRENAESVIGQLIRQQLTVARRREEKARERHVGKETFAKWSDKFYREHRNHIAASLLAVLDPVVRAMVDGACDITNAASDAAGFYVLRTATLVDGWEQASMEAIEETAVAMTEAIMGVELCTAS